MTKDNKAKEPFFTGLKREFRQIIWPKKKDIAKQVALIVVTMAVIAVLIALLDSGLQKLISYLFTVA